MKVRQLTTEQKNTLVGQSYDGVQFFNPTLDANGAWFISNEEYFNCTTAALFGWTLPEIDYNPVITELP